MNGDDLTLAHYLTCGVLPRMLVMLAVCGAWLMFCRWYRRNDDRAFADALSSTAGLDAAPLDAQLAALVAARRAAGRGCPGDRLFVRGLLAATALAVVYVSAWLVGVTPAKRLNRA